MAQMQNLVENNVIRFLNVTRRKDGIFANFKIKGQKGGTMFTVSIAVDISAAEVDPADPLEKIIEECAKMAVREFQQAEFTFEGLANI